MNIATIAESFQYEDWNAIKVAANLDAKFYVPSIEEKLIFNELFPKSNVKFGLQNVIEHASVVMHKKTLKVLDLKSLKWKKENKKLIISDGVNNFYVASLIATFICPSCTATYNVDLGPCRGLAKDNAFCRSCCKLILHKCRSYQEKFEASMLKKYGAKRPLQNKDILDRMQATMFERYGAKTGGEAQSCVAKRNVTMLAKYGKKNYFSLINPWVEFNFYDHPSFSGNFSKIEKEFAEAVNALCTQRRLEIRSCLGKKHVQNVNGTIIAPDIYIPELKLVIEFLGDYWHANPALFESEKRFMGGKLMQEIHQKDEIRLRLICESLNAKSVCVWEYDWRFNREEIMKKLSEVLDDTSARN